VGNLLVNPGFEELWAGSRRCVVLDGGELNVVDVGNIQCPKGWAVWFMTTGSFEQPEGRMSGSVNPDRMRSGLNGYALFRTYATHYSGLMQKVLVAPGSKVRFGGFAHAWSNHCDSSQPDEYPHCDEPGWSEGAGYECWMSEEMPDDERLRNFAFWLGVDPLGGIDPLAESVVCASPVHIYNCFGEVPAVECVADGSEVTVFCYAHTLWPYKHNDAYWDDFSLVVIDEPPAPVVFDKVARLVPQDTTK